MHTYRHTHMCTYRQKDRHTYVHDRLPALVWQRQVEPALFLPPSSPPPAVAGGLSLRHRILSPLAPWLVVVRRFPHIEYVIKRFAIGHDQISQTKRLKQHQCMSAVIGKLAVDTYVRSIALVASFTPILRVWSAVRLLRLRAPSGGDSRGASCACAGLFLRRSQANWAPCFTSEY